MGYFDALGEALFKEDEEGNTVFYKWGVMGRGVVIDTPQRKEKILSFVSTYYFATFLMIFIMQSSIFFLHMPILEVTLFFVAMGLAMTYWYLTKSAELTRGLPYATTRLTMANGWQKTAHRLPRHMLYGGFVSMVLLVILSIIAIVLLKGPVIWAALFLMAVGIFASYAYYRMILFSREAAPIDPVDTPSRRVRARHPSTESEASIEWNSRNIAIIGALLAAVSGFVYYSYADSRQGFDERMARYNAMTTEEMAAYLAGVNADPEQLDPITRHAGSDANGTTIYLYRELTANILSEMVVDVNNLEEEKAKMTAQLQREMCGSPTYDLFYDKGGELVFVYRQIEENDRKFMFEVRIDKASCS
jgi:hypothetical protein